MKTAPKISPVAMQVFLKQAALEKSWTTAFLKKALGLDLPTAKSLADGMALAGYIEPIRGKRETWRNTAAGNKLAGVRPPRLTRSKAEELLTDLEDRAAQIGVENSVAGIQQVVAFGSILTEHDPIQDIDVGVQFAAEPSSVHHEQRLATITSLKGRSPALKMHPWDDTLAHLPTRVVWKA